MTKEIKNLNESNTKATTSYNNTKVGNRAVTPTRQTIVTNNIQLNDENTAFIADNTTESPLEFLKTILGNRKTCESLEEEGTTELENLVSTFKRVKHCDVSMTFYYMFILFPFIPWAEY